MRGHMNFKFITLFLKGLIFSKGENQAQRDYNNVFKKEFKLINQYLGKNINKKSKILIFGCGYNYPDVYLFSTITKDTFGVDIQETFYRDGLIKLIKFYKKDENIVLAILKAIYERRKYSGYFKTLQNYVGKLNHNSLKLLTVEGNKLPYPNNYFDVIVSNAVLEHVSDVKSCLKEMNRIIKPGGIAYHVLHNYYSLTGAHVPNKIVSNNPWGHLLGNKDYISYLRLSKIYLNKIDPYALKEQLIKAKFNLLLFEGIDAEHNISGSPNYNCTGEDVFSSLIPAKRKILLDKHERKTLLTECYLYIAEKKDNLS